MPRGAFDGAVDNAPDSTKDGAIDGFVEGTFDGVIDCFRDGAHVGLKDGVIDGANDGLIDGEAVMVGLSPIFIINVLNSLKFSTPRPVTGSHPGAAEKP